MSTCMTKGVLISGTDIKEEEYDKKAEKHWNTLTCTQTTATALKKIILSTSSMCFPENGPC